jgi:aromatic amino acid transport protein AroP
MLGILVIMSLTPDMRIAVYMIPAWIGCLSVAYWIKQRKYKAMNANLILNPDRSFK